MGMMIDEVKARCDLGYYAKLCRYHDWTYRQSDDFSCFTRGEREQKTLVRLSETSPNHKRIWVLACGYHGKYNGDWTFEDGWRWAGAYLWSHGLSTITEEQAQTIVAPVGTLSENHRAIAGCIDWKLVDRSLESVK